MWRRVPSSYHTPGGQRLFRAGSGGMVNSNVLHRTQSLKNGTALRLHLFEAELLAGVPGGTVQQRYITPLVQRPGLELLALSPEVPGQAAALDLLRQSLYLDEDAFGYELRLQALLSEVWLAFVQQLPQLAPAAPERSTASDKVKQMILFMTAHAAEKLSVADIAQRCGLGSSSYFGAQFRQHFGCSPTAYRAKWQDIDTPGHKSDSRTAASDATMEP